MPLRYDFRTFYLERQHKMVTNRSTDKYLTHIPSLESLVQEVIRVDE